MMTPRNGQVEWLNITAGILMWGQVRDLYRQVRFLGGNLEMYESRGLIERKFIFKGDRASIAALMDALPQFTRTAVST